MYGPGSARRLVSSDLLTWNGGRNPIYPLKTFSCMEQSDCIFIFQQHTFLWFLGFGPGTSSTREVAFGLKDISTAYWRWSNVGLLRRMNKNRWSVRFEWFQYLFELFQLQAFAQAKHKQPPGVDIKHGFPRQGISFHHLSLVQVHRALQQLHHTKQRRCGTRLGQLLRSGCNLDEAWPLLRELLKSKESWRHSICKKYIQKCSGQRGSFLSVTGEF